MHGGTIEVVVIFGHFTHTKYNIFDSIYKMGKAVIVISTLFTPSMKKTYFEQESVNWWSRIQVIIGI